jgi:hypothetical protein
VEQTAAATGECPECALVHQTATAVALFPRPQQCAVDAWVLSCLQQLVMSCSAALTTPTGLQQLQVLLAGKPAEEVEAVLAESRKLLHERRAKRPRPHLDDKVLHGLWLIVQMCATRSPSCEAPGLQADYPFAIFACAVISSVQCRVHMTQELASEKQSHGSLLTAGRHGMERPRHQRLCKRFPHPGLRARTCGAALPCGGAAGGRLPAGRTAGAELLAHKSATSLCGCMWTGST